MMRSILVLCDHANSVDPIDQFDQVLRINQTPPKKNLRLEVWNISHWLLKSLNPIARDLLEIAAFVYYADNSVARGSVRDLFNENWARRFKFIIPVRKVDIWQHSNIKTTLTDMLEFLTGDKYEFLFTQRESVPEQLVFEAISDALPPCPDADCVSLFSGGMDSLAGVIYLHADKRRPVLVSHQSRPSLVTLQKSLALKVREVLPSWDFPHLGVRINRMGNRAIESSQRSRSFLFMALGSLVAHELGFHELIVCENGITSFNLPRLGQVTGTLASRSTNPRFLELCQSLVSAIIDKDFKIITPFLWKTRAEVLEVMKQNNCEHLLPLSSSCAQSQRTKMHPHCGICSQCVDRRFAVTCTGLDTPDEIHAYEIDIFTNDLGDGEEKIQAVSTVQFALDLMRRESVDSFCEQYVEIYEVLGSITGETEDEILSIYKLYRRFAAEIYKVMGSEYSRNWDKKFEHKLPKNCLLMLTGSELSQRPNALITEKANQLIQRLQKVPVGKSKPFEDICEEIFTFLFCEDLPPEQALTKPRPQYETDQGYQRRDLVFENRATNGFWGNAYREYDATGLIVDSKNYTGEIYGATVLDFSTKYLKEYGLGRFGIIVARKIPTDIKSPAARNVRPTSAVEAQKNMWRDDPHKMIILLEEDDVIKMLEMKSRGEAPTDLLRDRVFTLKSRQ